MRLLFYLLLIFFLTVSIFVAKGQDFEISGRIIDADSKDPIPFANIALKEIYKGTASNVLGEFSFKVDSVPVVLIISHLSYEPLEIEVKNTDVLEIGLTPGKLLMDELVIKAQGSSSYSYDLVNKAFYKITSQYNKSQYGKAFYRQISKNGDEYSELYEMFYDTRFNLNGVDDWAIQEGRYALKLSTADSFIYNKNFTLMVRLLTIVQPKTDDLIMPVSEQVDDQYDLRLIQLLSVNNRKVAQINFKKKDHIKYPAMEGDIYIDIDTYNVLKIDGVIANDNLKFITLKGDNGSWKNYTVTCEMAFKPMNSEEIVLDYIRLGQNFDYYYDGIFTNKVETRSFLTYYEYYTPPSRKKLGGRLIRFNKRDSDILDNIGYNQSFWDENIIVKRTPIEVEVTTSFEEERAFGSIYLNNKNQIILEDYEMDNDPFIINAKEQLKQYLLPKYGEKVYLHHDKPYYAAGEKMWFKAYAVNMATNIILNNEGVMHVELMTPDGHIIWAQLLHMQDGATQGQFQVPDELESGEYILRAYTDKMKSFDEKLFYTEVLEIFQRNDISERFRKIQEDSISTLTYYPEGGQLIESLPMQLGFIAKDQFGEGMDIRAKLVGEDGRQVASLKNESDGYGSVFVMPKTDFQYHTMVMSHEIDQIKFPETVKSGYSVMVNNLKPNAIDISVRGTMKMEGKKFYILVISNGVLYDRRIGAITRGLYKAELPKSNLPNGISQVLLVDNKGVIKTRRLVFINQPDEVVVEYYLAKKDFRPRERIDMVLELNDENGKSINGANISVSVVDADKVYRDENNRNIRSYFNLEYLADHKIYGHNDLFIGHEREVLIKLDWIMLAQQTTLPQIISFDSVQTKQQPKTPIDEKIVVTGKVTELDSGKPLENGRITIVSYPNTNGGFLYANTDENGNFALKGIYFRDSTRVIIKANDSAGAIKKVSVEFDEISKGVEPIVLSTALVEQPSYGIEYLERVKKISVADDTDHNSYDAPFAVFTKPYGKADFVVAIDEKLSKEDNLMDIFSGRFPGVDVSDKGGSAVISIRGEQGAPLILLDGIPAAEYILGFENVTKDNLDSLSLDKITTYLSEIEPEDLQHIEVIRSNSNLTQVFGESARHGIIALYSKSNANSELQDRQCGLLDIHLPGFAIPEPFSSPDYSGRSGINNKSDSRSTVYWNPDVKINRRGRGKIGFYNSDEARNLQICVEGVSEDGVPIFSIFEIGKNAGRGRVN